MKNKKTMVILSGVLLYFVLMMQLLWIYYVDYIYVARLNNEANVNVVDKSNKESEEVYALDYSDSELTGFKLLNNSYVSGDYVKHYSFNGEKYDILSKINSLEKRNIKIRAFEMISLDDNNVLGKMTMEYKTKGKVN